MSEIEKLFENAGIEPIYYDCCKLADKYWDNENLADEYTCFDRYMEAVCPHNQECTDECKNAYDKTIYPEFTAEKQIELIKWLIANGRHYFTVSIEPREFTEYLARYVNEVWLVLSDTEKAEIKRILE